MRPLVRSTIDSDIVSRFSADPRDLDLALSTKLPDKAAEENRPNARPGTEASTLRTASRQRLSHTDDDVSQSRWFLPSPSPVESDLGCPRTRASTSSAAAHDMLCHVNCDASSSKAQPSPKDLCVAA